MYKNARCLLLILCMLASCKPFKFEFNEQQERIKAYNNMLQADTDFSKRSEEIGIRRAFLEYIENDAVILRPGELPRVDGNAIDFLSSMDDSLAKLVWNPMGGDISQTADMGYTFGTYNLQLGDSLYTGSYVTVWKRQENGNWKFVLDSRNEGVGSDK